MSDTATRAMTWLIQLSDKDENLREQIITQLTSAVSNASTTAVAAPTLAGTINGGDILVHARCTDEDAGMLRVSVDDVLAQAPVDSVDSVEYGATPPVGAAHLSGTRQTPPPTIYRALLLRVDDRATPEQIARFERDLLLMPVHVTSIATWQLSHVTDAGGPTEWTHVWEQTFTDLDGLRGQYMAHPIHWGVVDRWFDPEWPENIVVDRVAHSFCALG
ncbi:MULTISPECIES: Dabb family protein [Rhodococcus]|uniref:Dabb family protein n=1 Tax=Rhodococcus artemisiae TaxID=714159 RepID=A0ABU7LKA0_9NOCA|nr:MULTISPECIES: Dabb family protein [Rhodococcus]MEE2061984.1 Dabb family protein [Rhodococcus artemisiae]TCN50910.1 stress responsive alpha/beta barrel protein [Rhodococcus sp. SMB37]